MQTVMTTDSPAYNRLVSTRNPGLILILLDQSGSMDEPPGDRDNRKCRLAAQAVNRLIYNIGLACRDGEEIRNRCFVGVLGYGQEVKPVVGGDIPQVYESPLRVENTKRMVSDGAGGLVEVSFEMPIWVEPTARNGTPMARALDQAHGLVSQWLSAHMDSFPPVVINITDGEPDDYDRRAGTAPDTRAAAERLMQLSTSEGGRLLLFNAHFSGARSPAEVILPAAADRLSDPYAKLLFSISCTLPASLVDQARLVGLAPQPGARGCVFNATAETLIKLLVFGSSKFSSR